MTERKKIKKDKPRESLPEEIEKTVSGLYFLSETDSEIFAFLGEKAEAVTKEAVLAQTKNSGGSEIEERDFEEFFSRLTKIEDWFGDEEIRAAQKFLALQKLLEKNLKDLKVFRIGKIELDIYAVGLDPDGRLAGIRTKAVET